LLIEVVFVDAFGLLVIDKGSQLSRRRTHAYACGSHILNRCYNYKKKSVGCALESCKGFFLEQLDGLNWISNNHMTA
jgi:hypothetical protein